MPSERKILAKLRMVIRKNFTAKEVGELFEVFDAKEFEAYDFFGGMAKRACPEIFEKEEYAQLRGRGIVADKEEKDDSDSWESAVYRTGEHGEDS
jgi:hypothetical protein